MSIFSPTISPAEYERVLRQSEFWTPLVLEIAEATGSSPSLTQFPDGSNVVFASGSDRVIKVFPKFMEFQFEAEVAALRMVVSKVSVPTPALLHSGYHAGWPFLIMSRVEGLPLSKEWKTLSHDQKRTLMGQLGEIVAKHHAIKVDRDFPGPKWAEFLPEQKEKCFERHQRLGMPQALLQDIPHYLEAHFSQVPIHLSSPVLLTCEYTPPNILCQWEGSQLKISGLIDYGDTMIGFNEYDLIGPCTFLAEGNRDLLIAFLNGYGFKRDELNETLKSRLMTLLLLHRYSNFDIQIKIPNWRECQSISDLEDLIWPF